MDSSEPSSNLQATRRFVNRWSDFQASEKVLLVAGSASTQQKSRTSTSSRYHGATNLLKSGIGVLTENSVTPVVSAVVNQRYLRRATRPDKAAIRLRDGESGCT